MTRRHISTTKRVKLFADKKGICHLCKGRVQPGEAWDVSHPIPLALGGADDETNWDVAHKKCHQVETSEKDVPAIAKAKRREAIHIGAKIKGNGFPPAKRNGRASAPLTKKLPPRRLTI